MLHRGGFAERASSESLQNTSTLTIPDTTSHSLSGFSLPKCPAALPTKLQSHVPWTHLALPNAPMLVWIGRGPGHVNPQPIGLYWSWFWGGGTPGQQAFSLTGWRPHVGMRTLLIPLNPRRCGLLCPFPRTLFLLPCSLGYSFTVVEFTLYKIYPLQVHGSVISGRVVQSSQLNFSTFS